jgi:hypothetical protein
VQKHGFWAKLFEKLTLGFIDGCGVRVALGLSRLGQSNSHFWACTLGRSLKTAYDNFLILWKNADAGIPILRQAKSECGKL